MPSMKPVIGVLALQGDFIEHINTITHIGYEAIPVRTIAEAEETDGLIIPGGESTAIGKLLISTKLDGWIKKQVKTGYPVYGTCAGCILIAKNVDSPYSLKLIDISVKRNAYGRQLDSFETKLQFKHFGKTEQITGVFIRAPKITAVTEDTTVLIKHNSEPVLVREDNILAGTFHPELTDSITVHHYFIQIVKEWLATKRS